MSQYNEFRYCRFVKRKVPICVEVCKEHETITYQYLACNIAFQCTNKNCKWKSQKENMFLEDYTLIK